MQEFFLVLSSMGKAYRRCQLAWVNGNQVGVDFLKAGKENHTSFGPVMRLNFVGSRRI